MRNRFTNLGWLITIIIALVPIVIWLVSQPTDWSTTKLIVENLGKLCGLAGLALFCWSVILSARLKIFDKLFLGLDNMYRAHHLIACWALILLLIHPMLLTTRYLLSSPISAYEFLKPSFESPFRFLGEFTLACFMGLMAIVLYFNIRYKQFVLTMKLLGALVFLGGIHAIFVGGSDITTLLPLQVYILGLLALAASVYVYRSLVHKGFHKYYNYTVQSAQQKGEIIELHLTPIQAEAPHMPGQFAFLKLETKGELNQSHPFTISSHPSLPGLRFSIKQVGDFTKALSNVQKGTTAIVDGGYGTFSNTVVHTPRQVWVAGGIGITPFLAMAKQIPKDQKVDLFYSLKSKTEAVYLDELSADVKANPNLRLHTWYSDSQGLLSAEEVSRQAGNVHDATYFVCGPPAMMKALRKQFNHLGVKNSHIQTEEFSLE